MCRRLASFPKRAYTLDMSDLTNSAQGGELARETRDPNPLVAFVVGLLYVFRTAPGRQFMRELDAAVRKYSADPGELIRLLRTGDEVIDTTATEEVHRKEG